MKFLTFISVEGSQAYFKRLFNFKECTIYVMTSGNEFVFYKYEGHKGYKIKSIDDLKIEDHTISDKNGDLYIIGKEIHKEKGTYLVDLSGVHEEKISLIMNEIANIWSEN